MSGHRSGQLFWEGASAVLQRAITVLERILYVLASAGLLGSIGLAFAAVILRYLFNQSLEWIEEGARYLALFAALLVAGPVLRSRGHVSLDLLTAGLRGRLRQVHRLVASVVALLVSAGVFVWGLRLVLQTYEIGLLSGSLQFPQWLPYSIVPLGMAFLMLFSLSEILAAIHAMRTGSGPPALGDGPPEEPGRGGGQA